MCMKRFESISNFLIQKWCDPVRNIAYRRLNFCFKKTSKVFFNITRLTSYSLVIMIFCQCGRDATLSWQQENGYRWAELNFNRSGKVGFTLLPSEKTGMAFQNDLTEEQLVNNHVLANGSGVAIGDVDRDGFADVYFCRLNGPNVLYKNLGNWTFQDITEQAGVACPEQFSSGAVFADIDGDSDLDLLVTSIGGKIFCFLNDGAGNFTDASEASGIKSGTGATTMALADVDNDGDLDLYVTNYKALRAANIFMPQELNFENIIEKNNVDGQYKIREKFKDYYDLVFVDNFLLWEERGEPNVLYLNNGKGQFQEIPYTDGAFLDEDGQPSKVLFDWGLAAKFQDLNNDSHPDLYVCNDFNSPDRIWINDGTGRFHAIAKKAIRHTSHSSMAVDFSDIERDGDVDLFVLDMLGMSHQRRKMQFNTMPPSSMKIGVQDDRPQYMRNMLFVNQGDNTYAEIGRLSGVHASDWSWAVNFLDIDLDGYEDILIATGQINDTQNMDSRTQILNRTFTGMVNSPETILKYPRLELPNVCFRNNGDLTFTETSDEWGWGKTADISHGMALGDLDNDGDLDVVVNRFQEDAAIYRNDAAQKRVTILLKGEAPNTQGIGAKIRVISNSIHQTKEVSLGGTYLSSSMPVYSFAAGGENETCSIEVHWRSGKISAIRNAKPNRIYEIDEAKADDIQRIEVISNKSDGQYFQDVSNNLNHRHHEESFNDFNFQPLLPERMGQFGPGAAFLDIDNDGDDDVVVANGKGGGLAVFNNANGVWRKSSDYSFAKKNELDQTAVIGWAENENFILMVGNSNYENPAESSFISKYTLYEGKVQSVDTLNFGDIAIGALAAADYDNDGDLDLFAGGRIVAGKYPAPPRSLFYQNVNGNLFPDEKNNSVLQNIGMVSSVVFSDIDNDSDPDLVLALQWGPVTILRNEKGNFYNATKEFGLHEYLGLWNGVATGDLNEDGKLDIVVTNWGRNSKYQPVPDRPVRMYFSDFDVNGTFDVIESYFDPAIENYAPFHSFEKLMRGIAFTRIRVQNFAKYAHASLDLIIGSKLNSAGVCSLNTVSHTLFLSKENGFIMKPLPLKSQFAPAFYIGVTDYNGDGHEDIFLTQNFFGALPEDGKDDAGNAIWLTGDGAGNLEFVPSQDSGIAVFGEQRGAALGDFNSDSRVDLLVTQNSTETRLYKNIRAQPGLKIKLQGNAKNQNAIGARVRAKYKSGFGPMKEIQAGSGYWSQNTSTIILSQKERIVSVQVFWPGGEMNEYEMPGNATSLTIDFDGSVNVE